MQDDKNIVDESSLELENEPLEQEKTIETLENELEEMRNKYLRALADRDNDEKRFIQERKNLIFYTEASVLSAFLPCFDNLERAEIFVKDLGLKMVKDEFVKTGQQFGLFEIDVLGQKFDPNKSEVISTIDVENEEENGIIKEVVAKGYLFKDKIVRPAKVIVGKKI